MSIRTRATLVATLALTLVISDALAGGKGGGGGGKGGGGGGGSRGPGGGGGMRGWGFMRSADGSTTPWWRRERTVDPAEAARRSEQKAKKEAADGWEALRAGDAPAAFEAFADALQLNPNLGEARLGQGIARALKGDFTRAIADIDASRAMTVKPDLRLVNYNAAVAHTRAKAHARAMVLLNKPIYESLGKSPDELALNAQLTILSWLDDKQRKAIGQMPEFLKTVSIANGTLGSKKYGGYERFGLAWVPTSEIRRQRDAGVKESFPARLPFLTPALESVGEGDQTVEYAALMPNATADDTAMAKAEPAKPATPEPVKPKPPVAVAAAKPEPVKPTGPFKLGGSGTGDSTSPPASTPAKPEAVAVVTPALPEVVAPAAAPVVARPVTRTFRGAAFAVSNDTLVTAARLVNNAKEIQLQLGDGKLANAKVLAVDEASGLALIQASGASFRPMGLAPAATAGKVGVAAFVKPTVFNPDLDLVAGDLVGAPGALYLKCVTHPRSAGSPVVSDKGYVLAVVTATREDAPDKLPVVTVDVLRKFVEGKVTLSETTSDDPEGSVAELTATRQD
ncbi:MAG: trypsin-like peptidase domain-containing protein [Phycisphaerae bacterium]|nr:trypsin-like peptidase domain-containing protein [Tepidisphaeraceae bacterium]